MLTTHSILKLLLIWFQDNPTLSGHTDFYYPELTYSSSHCPNELPGISKIKCVPIPSELMEQYSRKRNWTWRVLLIRIWSFSCFQKSKDRSSWASSPAYLVPGWPSTTSSSSGTMKTGNECPAPFSALQWVPAETRVCIAEPTFASTITTMRPFWLLSCSRPNREPLTMASTSASAWRPTARSCSYPLTSFDTPKEMEALWTRWDSRHSPSTPYRPRAWLSTRFELPRKLAASSWAPKTGRSTSSFTRCVHLFQFNSPLELLGKVSILLEPSWMVQLADQEDQLVAQQAALFGSIVFQFQWRWLDRSSRAWWDE